jgi:type II secretion system protein H
VPRGRPRSRRRDARAGFTFIELLVVIAILALVASIVVVNLDGMTAPTRLRGLARTLGNQMLQLKEIAGIENRPLSIEFDIENQQWRVLSTPSETEVPDPKERESQKYVGDWERPPVGVRIEEVSFSDTDVDKSGSTVITFQGDGEVSPSGFVVFVRHERLEEDAGISVEVSGLTGLVAYHDGHFKAEEIRRPEDF